MSKTWFCEEDEAPIPEGEAVEIKIRTYDDSGTPLTGYETLCKHHAEKRGYDIASLGEWRQRDANSEYLVEEL